MLTAFIFHWKQRTICFRLHLIAGPKAEKEWPNDERDVLLKVSHSRLTLSCSWLLILISLKLSDEVWLCGIFYINVNLILKQTETWTGVRIRCWTKRSMFWSSEKALRRGQNLPFTPSDVSVKTPLCVFSRSLKLRSLFGISY